MPTKNEQKEITGVMFGILHAAFLGIFPIVISEGVGFIPPIAFAGLASLFASIVAFIYLLQQKSIRQLFKRKGFGIIFLVTLFNIIIPHILLFVGAGMTSKINVAMLSLSEIVFTLIVTQIIGEKTTIFKLLGAGGVFLGGIFIVYNGAHLTFNLGDLLVILSTLPYAFGNFFSKKALNLFSPSTILFVRSIIGGAILLGISQIAEPQVNLIEIIKNHWPIILFGGIGIMGISKIMWYESFKRLDISKAICIALTYPLFSLIALVGFLHEQLSIFQSVGIVFMLVGIIFSVYRKSVHPSLTKYAPEMPMEE